MCLCRQGAYACSSGEDMAMRKTLRQVLARNLDKFYASSPVASSDAELGRRAEIDQTMVRRYRLMIVDPTLDKVEKLAKESPLQSE